MIQAIGHNWPALLLLLLLLALLGVRSPVVARGRLFIRSPAQQIFDLVDLKHGGSQLWHRARVEATLLDSTSQTYRIRYAVVAGGAERFFHAEFRVSERTEPVRLVLERAGLDDRPRANELLQIIFELTPAEGGTYLSLAYHWGPRPLIAQFLARTDLYGSLFRIKALAETGIASSRAEELIAAGVALVTGLATLAGFGLWFGWVIAIFIVVALVIHEFGHLVAFRLIGQPWGRMVFLPFLGGLAMPRLPYENDAQHAFAALMGPGFSVIALLPGVALAIMGLPIPYWIVQLVVVVAILNLFNLIPVEPLDGGVTLRTVFSRIFGRHVQVAMMASNGLIGLAGILLASPALALLGFVAAFANLRPRRSASPPVQLTAIQLAQVFGGFVIVAAAHLAGMATVYYHRMSYLHDL